MDFNDAFDLLIHAEGGYVNHPKDPGGATKYGVSDRADGQLDGLIDLDHDGGGDVPVEKLTLDEARAYYHRYYWVPALCPSFPDPLQFQLFDTAVNSGPAQAVKLLQTALGVTADGQAGPKTMAAIASANLVRLTVRFIAARLRFMTNLKTWDTFGQGWARRIADNLEEACGKP